MDSRKPDINAIKNNLRARYRRKLGMKYVIMELASLLL